MDLIVFPKQPKQQGGMAKGEGEVEELNDADGEDMKNGVDERIEYDASQAVGTNEKEELETTDEEDGVMVKERKMKECAECEQDLSTEEPAVLQAGLGDASCPGEEAMCGEHNQLLSLFCLDDLSPVCWECEESASHEGHRVYPIQDALQDCKEELRVSLQMLLQQLKLCKRVKRTYTHTATHISAQAHHTEKQIKEGFQKLHQFLREEEEARIAALKEEEEQRRAILVFTMERMGEKMWPLLYALWISEQDAREDDMTFLQNYKTTMQRIWQCKEKPENVACSLIDVPQHVANLRFRIWEKMQDIAPYTPVTLDPNTANSYLLLSDDLTSVRDSWVDCGEDNDEDVDDGEDEDDNGDEVRMPPNNPERFMCCGEMLGSERFTSGSHSWVVEVGDNSHWIVGVANASVSRKSLVAACPENGIWGVSLRRGRYEALESPAVRLLVTRGDKLTAPPPLAPRHIQVCVDLEKRRISFSDPDNHTHLHTFTHTFTEPLHPYFSTSCDGCPLRVLPAAVTMTTSHPSVERESEGKGEKEEEEGGCPSEMSSKGGLRVFDYLTLPDPTHLQNHTDL